MIILGFVAEMAGGKTTAIDYIAKKYKAPRYSFGIILRDLMDRLHLDTTRENYTKISLILRQGFGQDILAKAMTLDIKMDQAHEIIVVDSIRREEDILYLKELNNFHLISIKVDMKTRYERLIKRREKVDDENKTYEQFVKDHQFDTELSIIPLLDKAEFIIDNNGTLEKLYSELDLIINKIKLLQ